MFQCAATLPVKQDGTADPRFFLASVRGKAWAPRIVVVYRDASIVGILYAKERILWGVPTGIVYADGTLGTMVVAEAGDFDAVTQISIRRLFACPGVRGMRLIVRPQSSEHSAIVSAVPSTVLDVSYARVENHHHCLPLPSSYDELLDTFGPRTRRNFKYYRKRFEGEGHTYVDQISFDEFCRAGWYLSSKCGVGADPEGLNRAMGMFATVDRPVLVGLRDRKGEWLSILGGWYGPDQATVFFQLNADREHPRDSLSVVLRGYLMEMLIAKGISRLMFWAGAGGPLNRYVQPIPALGVYLDVRRPSWRILRRLSTFTTHLPSSMRKVASWIAPQDHLKDKALGSVRDSHA